jgi:hypothetical protein
MMRLASIHADRNVGRNYQIHTDNGTQLVSK